MQVRKQVIVEMLLSIQQYRDRCGKDYEDYWSFILFCWSLCQESRDNYLESGNLFAFNEYLGLIRALREEVPLFQKFCSTNGYPIPLHSQKILKQTMKTLQRVQMLKKASV